MTTYTHVQHIVTSALVRTNACPNSPGIVGESLMGAVNQADIASQISQAVSAAFVMHALFTNYTDEMLDATIEQAHIADSKTLRGTVANTVSTVIA